MPRPCRKMDVKKYYTGISERWVTELCNDAIVKRRNVTLEYAKDQQSMSQFEVEDVMKVLGRVD